MNDVARELVAVALDWVDACDMQRDRVIDAARRLTEPGIKHAEAGLTPDEETARSQLGSAFHADGHFLLIALNQLCKCIKKLREEHGVQVAGFVECDDAWRHRDMFEHALEIAPGWTDPAARKGRAAKRFLDAYGDRYPWVRTYGTSGRVRIGPNIEVDSLGSSLSQLRSELAGIPEDLPPDSGPR